LGELEKQSTETIFSDEGRGNRGQKGRVEGEILAY